MMTDVVAQQLLALYEQLKYDNKYDPLQHLADLNPYSYSCFQLQHHAVHSEFVNGSMPDSIPPSLHITETVPLFTSTPMQRVGQENDRFTV